MKFIKDKIPYLYHSFLPDFVNWEILEEKIATCSDCVMCRKQESVFVNTKCCTYHPQLPNYLVGGILQDKNYHLKVGKKRIGLKISNSFFPTGIFSSISYDSKLDILRNKPENEWDKSEAESVLCPYYDQGNCTIWNYRENCCSTHFCFSVGGEKGKAFWKKLNEYLKLTELELSLYALKHLGMNTPENSDSKKIEDVYNRNVEGIWLNWDGSKEEFYIETYNIVSNLTAEEFKNISSDALKRKEKEIHVAYNEFIDPTIPELLILNPKAVKKTNPISSQVSYDYIHGAIEFNPLIDKFIGLFDGKTGTIKIVEKIALLNIDFKEKYLKTLVLLEILIPFPTSHPHLAHKVPG